MRWGDRSGIVHDDRTEIPGTEMPAVPGADDDVGGWSLCERTRISRYYREGARAIRSRQVIYAKCAWVAVPDWKEGSDLDGPDGHRAEACLNFSRNNRYAGAFVQNKYRAVQLV